MAESTLSKKDVNKAFLYWWAFSHMTYNYQRLQAGCMAGMMGPIYNKLYPGNTEKMKEGMQRQLLYFNTEPRFGAVLPGMVVALEEGIATQGDDCEFDSGMVTEIKTALMGPLAGIGDTVWAGLIKPILLSITLAWALEGQVFGAWAYGILTTLLDFIITRVFFMQGYKLGVNSIDRFLEGKFVAKITSFLTIVGLFCLGVMICKYVSIGVIMQVEMTTTTLNIGEILNRIIPCFVPLCVTLFAYWMQLKGKSVTFVLLILFIVGFAGGAVGFLG